jgi:hypothetical protein
MRWVWAFAFVPCGCAIVAGLGDDYVAPADSPSSLDAGSDTTQDSGPPDAALGPDAPDKAGDAAAPDTGLVLCDYTDYFAFDGTLVGDAGVAPSNTDTPREYDTGKYGSCAKLGGPTQAPTSLDYQYGAKPIYVMAHGTIAMWFKPDSWAGCKTGNRVLYTSNGVSHTPYVDCTGSAMVVHALPSIKLSAPDASFTDDAWNHLAVTWGTYGAQILLNGALGTANETYSPDTTSASLTVGDGLSPPDTCYDELAIWPRALSADELRALYALSQPLAAACGR